MKREIEATSKRQALAKVVLLIALCLVTLFFILMTISSGFRLAYYEIRYQIGGEDTRVMAINKTDSIGEDGLRFFLDAARNDQSWRVRCAAYIALSHIGAEHPKVLPELLRAFDDEDWRVRANAAVLIGSFRKQGRSAIDKLEDVLRTEKKEEVRANLRTALDRLNSVD